MLRNYHRRRFQNMNVSNLMTQGILSPWERTHFSNVSKGRVAIQILIIVNIYIYKQQHSFRSATTFTCLS
jgi:hypothetical protein